MRWLLAFLLFLPFPLFAQGQLIYTDPFMNAGSTPEGWTLTGNWVINGDEELEAGGSRNAVALAAPVFPGCNVCRLETTIEAPDGRAAFLAWYSDAGNYVELSVKRDATRGDNIWRLRQISNGVVLAHARGRQAPLNPDAEVRIVFDGLRFTVQIDERDPIITMDKAPGLSAYGTAGYQVKRGIARFKFLNIYSS